LAKASAESNARRKWKIDDIVEHSEAQFRITESNQGIRTRISIADGNAVDLGPVAAPHVNDPNRITFDANHDVDPTHRRVFQDKLAFFARADTRMRTSKLGDEPLVWAINDFEADLVDPKLDGRST
jgi:hypothetical protein